MNHAHLDVLKSIENLTTLAIPDPKSDALVAENIKKYIKNSIISPSNVYESKYMLSIFIYS